MENNPRSVTIAADQSSGRRVDVELAEANSLWVAAGSGIEVADILMKDVADVADLRVRIRRNGLALDVSIDRGEQSNHWWPEKAAPTLRIALNPSDGTASATASAGVGAEFKSIEFEPITF